MVVVGAVVVSLLPSGKGGPAAARRPATSVPATSPSSKLAALANVPDKYPGKLSTCRAVAAKMTLPAAFTAPATNDKIVVTDPPGILGTGTSTKSECAWTTQSGDEVFLTRTLFHAQAGYGSGAQQAGTILETDFRGGEYVRDPGVTYADEAIWMAAKYLRSQNCVLILRSGNLEVYLLVDGPTYPRGKCEALTTMAGRAAVQAMAR